MATARNSRGCPAALMPSVSNHHQLNQPHQPRTSPLRVASRCHQMMESSPGLRAEPGTPSPAPGRARGGTRAGHGVRVVCTAPARPAAGIHAALPRLSRYAPLSPTLRTRQSHSWRSPVTLHVANVLLRYANGQ